MTEPFFVYGTLAPGKPNAHVLADVPGSWAPATVRGRLLQEGWGAAAGYSGIVPDESGEAVEGMVFSSEHLAAHGSRVHAFEGDGYERVLVRAKLRNGASVDACVYRLSGNAPGRKG